MLGHALSGRNCASVKAALSHLMVDPATDCLRHRTTCRPLSICDSKVALARRFSVETTILVIILSFFFNLVYISGKVVSGQRDILRVQRLKSRVSLGLREIVTD